MTTSANPPNQRRSHAFFIDPYESPHMWKIAVGLLLYILNAVMLLALGLANEWSPFLLWWALTFLGIMLLGELIAGANILRRLLIRLIRGLIT